ncbi:MAG: GNAT family N-acetyltransferase [Bacillota bacterium]|nr:GNAT family N-acetyltransferase [Bacillota bacterium]
MLSLQAATGKDLPVLARMSCELIEDEGATTSRSLAEVEHRLAEWLEDGWSIDLFLHDGDIAGYAIYQFRPDEYYPERTVAYLRDFFIARPLRRQGLGRLAFDALIRERFPAASAVVLEVLVSNDKGREFWSALGFQPFSITMKLPLQGA